MDRGFDRVLAFTAVMALLFAGSMGLAYSLGSSGVSVYVVNSTGVEVLGLGGSQPIIAFRMGSLTAVLVDGAWYVLEVDPLEACVDEGRGILGIVGYYGGEESIVLVNLSSGDSLVYGVAPGLPRPTSISCGPGGIAVAGGDPFRGAWVAWLGEGGTTLFFEGARSSLRGLEVLGGGEALLVFEDSYALVDREGRVELYSVGGLGLKGVVRAGERVYVAGRLNSSAIIFDPLSLAGYEVTRGKGPVEVLGALDLGGRLLLVLRPMYDWVVLGEVRGAEVLKVYQVILSNPFILESSGAGDGFVWYSGRDLALNATIIVSVRGLAEGYIGDSETSVIASIDRRDESFIGVYPVSVSNYTVVEARAVEIRESPAPMGNAGLKPRQIGVNVESKEVLEGLRDRIQTAIILDLIAGIAIYKRMFAGPRMSV